MPATRPLNTSNIILGVLCVGLLACSRDSPPIDCRTADPVLAARRAVLDSGRFHVLAVRVGDAVLSPVDTSVVKQTTYLLQVEPKRAVAYLPIDPSPDRPGWPSDAQLVYIKSYNTTLLRVSTPMPGAGACRLTSACS